MDLAHCKEVTQVVLDASMLLSPYLTHLPALVGAVLHTRGDVLELGCGEGSTQVLHEICEAQGRRLVSADSSVEWVEQFEFLRSDLHEIIYIPDWDLWDLDSRHWGTAFVDHAPVERRKVDVERLRRRATYVVVHDTSESCYNYEPWLAKYKYRRDFKHNLPHTTVVSDFIPVWPV